MDRYVPKTIKIILVDFLSSFVCMFPLITLVLYALSRFVGFFSGDFPSAIPIWSGIIGVFILTVRLRYFKNLFTNGIVIEGEITKSTYFKGCCWITYTFEHQNEQFKRCILLNQSAWVKNLKPNDRVGIIINMLKPKQAVLKDAFL